MVKITSSTIDIYTVPNTAPLQRRQISLSPQQQHQQRQTPSTTNLRRKEFRQQRQSNDFSMKTNEFFYDSSDSETSFFDDSDDNDDVTVFFGRHAQNYRNLRNGEECSMTKQQQKQQNFKKRNIVKSCEMLASPRTERKSNNNNNNNNNNNIKSLKTSQTTSKIQKSMSDLGFRPPLRNFSVPNLSSWGKKLSEDNQQIDVDSFSPRLKRKQTDITKSAAFKEIYARNLRLYSKVLAKVRLHWTF